MDPTIANATGVPAVTATGAITTVHLVLMALLAIATIIGIWYGTMLSRRRKAAREQVSENLAVAEEHGAVVQPRETTPDDAASRSADVPDTAAPVPASPPAASATPIASDLTQLKGLGPKLAATLAEHGITRLDQIAALSPADADTLDGKLGAFKGRIARDRWVEQARLLMASDRAGYEAAFGKLGG